MSAHLHLLLGDDEFLIERARHQVRAQVQATSPDEVAVTALRAGEASEHELTELLSPSLFAEQRMVVFSNAADAGKEPAALVESAARDLPEGIVFVVEHTGGGRAKSLADELKRAGAQVHDCATLKAASDRVSFVRAEFSTHAVKVSGEVAAAVVDAVGTSLRELASACSQLAADTGGKVTMDSVAQYYSGRADVTGFEIADHAVAGNAAAALESLAWARHHGVAHVLIADALAEAIHSIARVASIGGLDPNSAARQLGMPPWRIRKVQPLTRQWNADAIARGMQIAATLNGEVKGQAVDAEYSLIQAVASISALPRH